MYKLKKCALRKCGRTFMPRSGNQSFCSKRCAREADRLFQQANRAMFKPSRAMINEANRLRKQ